MCEFALILSILQFHFSNKDDISYFVYVYPLGDYPYRPLTIIPRLSNEKKNKKLEDQAKKVI